MRKIFAMMEEIKAKNFLIEKTVASIKSDLSKTLNEIIERKKIVLCKENELLRHQIAATKADLIALETRNGKKQISIPKKTPVAKEHLTSGKAKVNTSVTTPLKVLKEKTLKIVKLSLDANAKAPIANAEAPIANAEAPIDVSRLDMRVGRIVAVERHPHADNLYVEKIDCGEDRVRIVVSGLVKFVPLSEMKNCLVVVMCNLKPAKMRGIISEGMVMCACTPNTVEILRPPSGSVPGDLVHCETYSRSPDVQLNPKKKIFETCAPFLLTNDAFIACYKGAPLYIPNKGNIVSKTLKNVQVK